MPAPTRTASSQLPMKCFEGAQPVLYALGALTHPVAPCLRQNNPTGKFSLSPSGKSLLGLTPSCPRGRGVGHRHRTLGWDAVDAAVSGVKFVRRAVSVSGRRRAGRTMLKRTVKSCGPDASVVGVKSAEGKSARPGADEPAIRRRRRQQSPILRLVCVFLACFARETAGAARIRHFLLPLFSRGARLTCKPRAERAARRPMLICSLKSEPPVSAPQGEGLGRCAAHNGISRN